MANTVCAWPVAYDPRGDDGKPVIRARLLLGHGQEVVVNFNPRTIPDICFRLLDKHNEWEADMEEREI